MPGCGKMEDMDVSSTKLFKYQEKKGVSSLTPGMATSRSDKKEQKYQIKEGRYRVKAARKGRIIVVRLEPSAVESSCPTRP